MDKINLPETLNVDPTPVVAAADPPEPTSEELIRLLHFPSHLEVVLSQLVKKRDTCENLALLLWNSFNVVFILLQEVMSIYMQLPPSNRRITVRESTHVCNAISLFQCMAAHPLTRMELIRARIIDYLHPFLGITATDDKPLEFLRLSSLGVIGALFKIDDQDVQQIVHHLLESEVFPLVLHCMDYGDERAQTVSALIVMKIVQQDEGLKYCCGLGERFLAVVQVLGRVVDRQPAERLNLCLLRFVISCYLRLSQVPRAMDAFQNCIPARMTQASFITLVREDQQCARELQQLFVNITNRHRT